MNIEITGGRKGFIETLNRLTKCAPKLCPEKFQRVHRSCIIISSEPLMYLRREQTCWNLYQGTGVERVQGRSRSKGAVFYQNPEVLVCKLPESMGARDATIYAQAFIHGKTVLRGPAILFTFSRTKFSVLVENSCYRLTQLRDWVEKRGKTVNFGG